MSKTPNKDRIQELSEKWLNNTISETEKQEYNSWYNSFDDFEVHDLSEENLTAFLDQKYETIKKKARIGRTPLLNSRVKKLKRAILVAASICFGSCSNVVCKLI